MSTATTVWVAHPQTEIDALHTMSHALADPLIDPAAAARARHLLTVHAMEAPTDFCLLMARWLRALGCIPTVALRPGWAMRSPAVSVGTPPVDDGSPWAVWCADGARLGLDARGDVGVEEPDADVMLGTSCIPASISGETSVLLACALVDGDGAAGLHVALRALISEGVLGVVDAIHTAARMLLVIARRRGELQPELVVEAAHVATECAPLPEAGDEDAHIQQRMTDARKLLDQ